MRPASWCGRARDCGMKGDSTLTWEAPGPRCVECYHLGMPDGSVPARSGIPVGDEPKPPRFLMLPVSETAIRVAREVGRKRAVKAGELLQRNGGSPWVGVVGSGALRALVASSSGRQATLAYAPPGAVLGVVPTRVVDTERASLLVCGCEDPDRKKDPLHGSC